MKKFKVAITTLLIFTIAAFALFMFYINNPFVVENTIEEEFPRTNIQAEIEANEFFNDQYRGTQTAMDWGPVLLGKLSEKVMLIALGHCEGDCPGDAIIVNYLMYYRESTKKECENAWGYDLNIVTEGQRYCLFKIPESSCEDEGGSVFYDDALGIYLGCSAIQL